MSARTWRRAVQVLAVALVLALLAVPAASTAATAGHQPRTPIKHFVVLFQENHTFDNYFGTRPGVDGIPRGVCMPVDVGHPKPCVKPFWIGDRGSRSLGHTETTFRRQYDHGRMDGFVDANSDFGINGALTMGHYDARDLPYYWNVADNYTLFDHFFSSAKAGSTRNHVYAVAAAPGANGRSEGVPPYGWRGLRTIFDELQKAGVSWKFYVENYDPTITYRTMESVDATRASQVAWTPLLAMPRFLDNPELNKHIVDLNQYYKDLQTGHLPAVSYMVPSGNSEHPPGRLEAGEQLVRGLVSSLMRSPEWKTSTFAWTYDDWGGWYDHVPPPRVDRYGYGFRVPTLMVGPYVRKGFVDHRTADFTSFLAFIEKNWNVPPLTARDRNAYDLMNAFDFNRQPRQPVLLGTSRHHAAPEQVTTSVVYLLYAGAVGLVALLTLGAVLWVRRFGPVPEALTRLTGEPKQGPAP